MLNIVDSALLSDFIVSLSIKNVVSQLIPIDSPILVYRLLYTDCSVHCTCTLYRYVLLCCVFTMRSPY